MPIHSIQKCLSGWFWFAVSLSFRDSLLKSKTFDSFAIDAGSGPEADNSFVPRTCVLFCRDHPWKIIRIFGSSLKYNTMIGNIAQPFMDDLEKLKRN